MWKDINPERMAMSKAGDHRVQHGKYRGMRLGDIVQFDPSYIVWLRKNEYGEIRNAAYTLEALAFQRIKLLEAIAAGEYRYIPLEKMPSY